MATIHTGKLTMSIWVETDGNPNDSVNKMLDVLGEIDLDTIGVSWDSCAWDFSTVTTTVTP
jgi:hypothetical protein